MKKLKKFNNKIAMNEIRIRERTFLIGVAFLSFVIFYLVLVDRCDQSQHSNHKHAPDAQRINYKFEIDNGPYPFAVYAVTPTYARPVQKAELTRLAQTLLLAPHVHWIIVEDATQNSALVKNLLASYGLDRRSTLLFAKTPTDFKLKGKDPNWMKPRGVAQRNTGLAWIRKNVKYSSTSQSVVYFMDDDNTYSIELFEQMKLIQSNKVGVWPVGLVGGLMVEKPVLDDENLVLGFNSAWRPERPFPIDMAGFAVSTDLILQHPEAVFSYEIERGYQESEILRYLIVVRDMQPLADLCRNILVWHTRTETPKLDAEIKWKKEGHESSNKDMEV